MKRLFTAFSAQTTLLGMIGFGMLVVTALELAMLPRQIAVAPLEGAASPALPYHLVLVGLNTVAFLAIALAIRAAYARHVGQPLRELTRMLRQPLTPVPAEHDPAASSSASHDVRECAAGALAALTMVQTFVDELTQIAGPLSEASQRLLSGSQVQASRLVFQRPSQEDLHRAMRTALSTARRVDQDMRAVAESADDTARIAKRGQHAALNVSANLEELQRSARVSAENIAALEKQTEHVHEVVATIDSLIEDTKLIAFNATIEAARARDGGKGFGVVALEIKRLAEEVFESTEDIKAFVRELHHTSQVLVGAMDAELTGMRRGRALAEESGLALRHIVELAQGTADAARRIAADAGQQEETSAHALQLVETAMRALDQLGDDLRVFGATAEQLRQQTDALARLLRPPVPASNRPQRIETPAQ